MEYVHETSDCECCNNNSQLSEFAGDIEFILDCIPYLSREYLCALIGKSERTVEDHYLQIEGLIIDGELLGRVEKLTLVVSQLIIPRPDYNSAVSNNILNILENYRVKVGDEDYPLIAFIIGSNMKDIEERILNEDFYHNVSSWVNSGCNDIWE